MHILLVTGDMAARAGGPPKIVLGSAAALVERGHRVTIATLTRPGDTPLDEEVATTGVQFLSFPRQRYGLPGSSRAMVNALGANIGSYDVLHVHGVWERCLAQMAKLFRVHRKPVFVSTHGMLDRWSMRQSRWKKRLALRLTNIGAMVRRADVLVFGTADELREGAAFAREGDVFVPNGVNTAELVAELLPDPAPLLNRFRGIASWGRTLLYFSRIHPKKGLDLLVDAFIALAPQFPEAGLLVIGIAQDAAYQAMIEARIAAAGLGQRFAIATDLGPSAKMGFRVADIFVLPSHQEGFSMAILEALALGKPALITDKCHFPEVGERGAGLVVTDDAEGVAAGLSDLLARSDAELAAMGSRGSALIRQHYDWRFVAERLEALYASKLAS